MADMPSRKPKLKINRTSQACDRCHERKVRCDSGRPRCNQCWRSGLICSYGERKVPSNSNKTLDVNTRLHRLEQLVEGLVQKSSSPIPLVNTGSVEKEGDIQSKSKSMREQEAKNKQNYDARPLEVGYIVSPERRTGPSVYSHSILAILTSTTNLQLIGDRIGQPDMAQKFIVAIQLAQRVHESRKMALFMQHDAANLELDRNLELFCQREYHHLGSDVLYTILTPEESDSAFGDNSGLSAIIKPSVALTVICHMRLLGKTYGFSEDLLKRQAVVAFMLATRYWSLSGLLPHNNSLFRSLVLYALAMLLFTPLSQDIRALAVAYSAGQQLGLNDPGLLAKSGQSSSRDVLVWRILRELDGIISLSASEAPDLRLYDVKPLLCETTFGSNTDLQVMAHQSALREIHRKCYDSVFSHRALEKPHREIFEDILRLDADLDTWRAQTGPSIFDPLQRGGSYLESSPDSSPSCLASYIMLGLNMVFFSIKAQLHALPAFVNSFLKDVDDDVLVSTAMKSSSIASEAARNIIHIVLSTKQIVNFFETPLYQFCMITAHQTLFLYSMMFPLNGKFENDLRLINSNSTLMGSYSVSFAEILKVEGETLSRFRENLHRSSQEGAFSVASERQPASCISDGQVPSEFVPWVDLEASAFDQFPIDSCLAM